MKIVGERNTTRSLYRPSTRRVVARVVRSNSRSRLTTMVNVDRDTTTNARLRVHRALKESRPHVFFCRPPRFNWMSLLRCRALLSVPGPPFIGVYPPLFHSPDPDPAAWSAEPASPLLSSPLLSSPLLHSRLFSYCRASHPDSRVRSPAAISDPIFIVSKRPEPPHSSRMRRP